MMHFMSVLFFLASYFFCPSHRAEQRCHRSSRSFFGNGWSLHISKLVIVGTLLSAQSSLTHSSSPHSTRFDWNFNLKEIRNQAFERSMYQGDKSSICLYDIHGTCYSSVDEDTMGQNGSTILLPNKVMEDINCKRAQLHECEEDY